PDQDHQRTRREDGAAAVGKWQSRPGEPGCEEDERGRGETARGEDEEVEWDPRGEDQSARDVPIDRRPRERRRDRGRYGRDRPRTRREPGQEQERAQVDRAHRQSGGALRRRLGVPEPLQPAETRARTIRVAAHAAPKPLSMLTTRSPEAQLLS